MWGVEDFFKYPGFSPWDFRQVWNLRSWFGMDPFFTNQNYTYLFIWLLMPVHCCLCNLRCSWDRFLKFYLQKWSKNPNLSNNCETFLPSKSTKTCFNTYNSLPSYLVFIVSNQKRIFITFLFHWFVMKKWVLNFWTKCLVFQPKSSCLG